MRKSLLIIGAALALAGCGTGGKASSSGDQTNGQKQFQSKCGGCHVLAAAGTKGTVGPNLDNAFKPDYDQGFKESTVRNVVLLQIRQPSPPMPASLVKGEDAQDVAAYVAASVGKPGPAGGKTADVGTDGKAIFNAECSSCHTLQAAGASGTIGPNLDQLKPSQQVAQTQVEKGGGVMPAFKGKLSDEQITAVAKFVADNAGK